MARKRALKVFRTAIGFDDAYVAAPSRKAALAAWGTDKDLFARGAAELITDPALTAEPLARPGEVVRRRRGTLAQHLSAATAAKPPAGRKPKTAAPPALPAAKRRPAPRPKPPPSRRKLADAEAALAAHEAEVEAGEADLREREAALLREREDLRNAARGRREKLEERIEKTRDAYDKALERWRSES